MAGIDKYTTLMLHMNGDNNGTTFVDSSMYNTPVTAVGDAVTSTVQSVFGGSAGYFPTGSSTGLTLSMHSWLQLWSADFTVDFWLKAPSSASLRRIYCSDTTADDYFSIHIQNGMLYVFVDLPSGQCVVSTVSTTVCNDTWRHIAVVRNGLASGCLKIYIDGVVSELNVGTALSNQEIVMSGGLEIGGDTAATIPIDGYLDEFRVSRVARWLEDFTPPAEAYTDDYAPVDLDIIDSSYRLIISADGAEHSDTFTDRSMSAHTITPYGGVEVALNGKFDQCAKFAGVTDYLYIPSSTDFNLGFNDSTIHFWFKYGNDQMLWYPILSRMDASDHGWLVDYVPSADGSNSNTGQINFSCFGATASMTVYANNLQYIAANTWTHFALGFCGSTPYVFINGVRVPSGVVNYTQESYDVTAPLLVGIIPFFSETYTAEDPGYLDEVTIVKGKVLWYTDFTPPTAPPELSGDNFGSMDTTSGAATFVANNFTVGPTGSMQCVAAMSIFDVSMIVGNLGVLELTAGFSEYESTGIVGSAGGLAAVVEVADFAGSGIVGCSGVMMVNTGECIFLGSGVTGNVGDASFVTEAAVMDFIGAVDIIGVMTMLSEAASMASRGVVGTVGRFAGTTQLPRFAALELLTNVIKTFCLNVLSRGMVSSFTGYNFNSFAVIDGVELGSSSSGLYKLSGGTEVVDGKIVFPLAKFDTPKVKQARAIAVFAKTDGGFTAKITDGNEMESEIDLVFGNSGVFDSVTGYFPFTTRGRYLQVTLESTGNANFSLDQIDLAMYFLGRM